MHYMHFAIFILSLNFIKYSLHPSPYLLPKKETKKNEARKRVGIRVELQGN